MNIYQIEIEALCPADGLAGLYQAEISCEHTIPVEDIMRAADEIKASAAKQYQEYWAAWLARRLNARVILRGQHYGRVRIISEVG